MRFTLRIEVKGLFVVREANSEDTHHRIVAPRTRDVSGVPDLNFVVHVASGGEISDAGPLRLTEDGATLPVGTVLSVPEPVTSTGEQVTSGHQYPPATLNDLDLGSLRPGVGTGQLDAAEYGRVLLPTARATSRWFLNLGRHSFPARPDGFREEVADKFVWFGDYDDEAQLEVRPADGSPSKLSLQPTPHPSGGPTVLLVEILYKEDPLNELGAPFDYAAGLAPLTTLGWRRDNQPRRVADAAPPPHPGSSSCPPLGG